jgi:hypothetical protein
MCHRLNLKIRGVDFVASLIVLHLKGINDILGLDWLIKHKIPTDCAKKSFKLTTSDRNELEYIAKSVVIAKEAANHVKLNQ